MNSTELPSNSASSTQPLPFLTADRRLTQAKAGYLAVVLTVLGAFAVYSSVFALWQLWVGDPLKSIGGFVPIVSLLLIVRVWRSLGWEMDGSWWGLVILAATIALVHVRDVAILELVLSPSWSLFIPPHSLVAVLYAAGAVLLFGGTRLLMRTKFPVLLMWLVNPVPTFFTIHVDLPLQHVSSTIARGFAHLLGFQLTPDQLFLMFTPQFGMFIAPGCDGIRGAITMGLIALVAGYLYKFKPQVTALVVTCAVLLGYVFNLTRLCCLVLYYLVALHIPWLQTRAKMGDYIIGACLFFFATALLFTLIQKLGVTGDLWPPALKREGDGNAPVTRTFYAHWLAFALVAVVGSVSYAKAAVRQWSSTAVDVHVMGTFPQQLGDYHLVNRWNETMLNGTLVYYWGDYANASGAVVSVGVSPGLGAHDTLLCHAARGEDWAWHGNLPMATQQGEVSFAGSFFSEGSLQYMEASTVCTEASCGQVSTDRKHFGLVYSKPDTGTLLSLSPRRPMPLMLRTQTTDTHLSVDAAQRKLTADLRSFAANANLATITAPYRGQNGN